MSHFLVHVRVLTCLCVSFKACKQIQCRCVSELLFGAVRVVLDMCVLLCSCILAQAIVAHTLHETPCTGCLRSWVQRTSSWVSSSPLLLPCSLMSMCWSSKSAWTAQKWCPTHKSSEWCVSSEVPCSSLTALFMIVMCCTAKLQRVSSHH